MNNALQIDNRYFELTINIKYILNATQHGRG